MHFLLQLVALVLAFIVHEHETLAQYVPDSSSLVMPITKHTDTANPLYSVPVMTRYVNSQFIHTDFLIDTDAPFTWYNCIVQWTNNSGICSGHTVCSYPVSCEEGLCTDVRTSYAYESPSCPPVTNTSTLPGWGFCTCPVNVLNPVTGTCDQAMFNYDEFAVYTSNGRNQLQGFRGVYPNSACADSSVFSSFPANVSGVIALSRSYFSFSYYAFYSIQKDLAICLPSSSSAPGVLFIGGGPYYLHPHTGVDLRSLLSYTPLLSYPNSFGYFIDVKEISVNGISINISSGNTTTKLSTIQRYTALRTDIYHSLVRIFSTAAKRIRRAKIIKPFGLCLKTKTLRHRQGRLHVPDIVFGLQDGKNWTIHEANSMVRVRKDVACLAFVDGGSNSEHAIVMGTFQIEDNFLLFDLENSTLGFSSSLLYKQTSCANFNFTVVSG